jgi:hypothetical protein
MDGLTPGSVAFIQEAARRALSNSTAGHVVLKDSTDRSRFSGTLPWEGNFNGGEYKGEQTFTLKANDTFAMMMVSGGTIASLLTDPANSPNLALFSFGSIATASGGTIPRMVDVTGNGNTFGWEVEDIYTDSKNPNPDFNDLVFQVRGVTRNLDSIQTVANADQSWLDTATGVNPLTYTARSTYSSGGFKVGETGRVSVDYLFDGGWFQGELALFNLAGMEAYTPGSTAYIQEAARRAISDTARGRVLIRDANEGRAIVRLYSGRTISQRFSY